MPNEIHRNYNVYIGPDDQIHEIARFMDLMTLVAANGLYTKPPF